MGPSLIRLPETLNRTGLSRARLYALIKEGKFPVPLRLGARAVGWRSDEVAAWIDSRPRARESTPQDAA